MTDTITEYLARFAAHDEADRQRKARIDADWIVRRCRSVIARNQPHITSDGMAGGLSVFADLMSDKPRICKRAGTLLRARIWQITRREVEYGIAGLDAALATTDAQIKEMV